MDIPLTSTTGASFERRCRRLEKGLFYFRHLTPAQRAAIAVKHTEMLQHGSNRYENKVETQDCVSKTIDEVAKVAGVGVAICRAAF